MTVTYSTRKGYEMDGWIPVEEVLPLNMQEVLVFYRATDPDGTPSCVGIDGSGGMIALDCHESGRDIGEHWCLYGAAVTHWMPLPEPPSKKE